MKAIDNFDKEIDINILGLRRLEALGPNKLDSERTFELASKLISVCRNSELPYREIQKAIVYADNSLYRHLVPKDNDVL